MKNLLEIRKKRGHTTISLAALLGVCPSTITNWEKGIREPSIEMIQKITGVLNCTSDELLGIERREEGETA